MKKILLALSLLFSSSAFAQYWNNPFAGICAGEYRVISTVGFGGAELQINDERDSLGHASVGITPAIGVWQVAVRYQNFDDGGVDIDQYGVNFRVDFTLTCDVQCLYWMAGWNYAEIDVDTVEQHGLIFDVNDNGYDNFWNAGVGYRYNWNQNFDTSLEYNYNDIDRVAGFDLGHLRSWTLNLSYRF